MAPSGSWDDLFDTVAKERFAGREQELERFRKEINASPLRYIIFYLHGLGGVGKTTLLNRYRNIAQDTDFLIADTDEQQSDIPSVLGRFARQMNTQGFMLKRFDERYKTYRQKLDEIASDPEAPQGVFELLGRTAVRVAFTASGLLPVPGLQMVKDLLPQGDIETKAGEGLAYLAKKLMNKDDVALLRNPIPILTEIFFEELNAIAEKKRILLCFDNFEATHSYLQDWLLHLREQRPSQNIRLVIAGRDAPGTRWDVLRNVTLPISLEIFTEQEAEQFLDLYGIKDVERRREILEFSGRLPVLMGWLAVPEGTDSDLAVPTNDMVERFLTWVPDQASRQWALSGAIPQFFNVDLLASLGESQPSAVDAPTAFEWLKTMSFVQQRTEGWRYHPIVRLMMLKYQKQKSPQTSRRLHTAMAAYYDLKRSEVSASVKEPWTNRQWCKDTLVYIYHYLAANISNHWAEVMNLLVLAIRNRWEFTSEIIERLSQDDALAEMDEEQVSLVRFIHQQIQASSKGDRQANFALSDRLCHLPYLSAQSKGFVLALRGSLYQQDFQWEEALNDYNEALRYVPTDSMALLLRGVALLRLGHSDEAFKDLNQLLELDPQDGMGYVVRGEVLFMTGHHKEALADINSALDLDGKNTTALIVRWLFYLSLGRYDDGLADVNLLYELNAQNVVFSNLRGWTYAVMGQFDKALGDLDQALAHNEKDVTALGFRGATYFLMQRYQEALVDLDNAVPLSDKNSFVLTYRGAAHLLLDHYGEALDNLNQVIALVGPDVAALGYRGAANVYLARYQEALTDLDQVLQLDERNVVALRYRGAANVHLARYQEALTDLDQAIQLDEQNPFALQYRGVTNFYLAHYQEALTDLDQTLNLDEQNIVALRYRGAANVHLDRYQEALTDLDQALQLDAQNIWALQYRGVTNFHLAHYQEALADLDQAIQLDAQNVVVLRYRGATNFHLERYQEALADLDQAVKLDEQNLFALEYRGATNFHLERYQEALADLDQAVKLDEHNAWVLQYRGATNFHLDHYQEALTDLDQAIQLDAQNPFALRYRGVTNFYLNRYEEALMDLDQAIQLDEQNVVALEYRGATNFHLDHYQEALADLDQAVKLDEHNAWVLQYRGATNYSLDHYQEALADLNQAVKVEEDVWALEFRGATNFHLNYFKEALTDLNRAIALNEQNDWSYYLRAMIFMRQGQEDKWRSDLRIASEIAQEALLQESRPSNQELLRFNLALYHLILEDDGAAEEKYTQQVAQCTTLLKLQAALKDVTYFLRMEPAHERAKRIQSLLQDRINT